MDKALHSQVHTPPPATEYRRELYPPRLAWAPAPVFFVAIIGLWFNTIKAPAEGIELLSALNLVLTTAPFLGIAVLFFRTFLITGVPGIALFGCSAVLWSASGLASFSPHLAVGADAVNMTVTLHNLLVWAASLNGLAGAALLHRAWPAIEKRRVALSAAGALTLAGAALIAFAVLQGWTPVFFVQGEGATLERQFVLGSTILAILLTLSLLRKGILPPSPFLDWFSLALMLLAIGYFGLMLHATAGSALGWVNRAAQFLGGFYMLIAAYAAFRDTKPAFAVLAPSRDRTPHRFGIAFAIVVIAAVVRLVFLQPLGTGFAFLTFYPAVTLAALYGGWPAGALATFVGALVADYFWIEPPGSLRIVSSADWLAFAIFIFNCLLTSWIVELLQRVQAKLRSAESDRRAELERMVAERTAALGLATDASTNHLAAATATEAELQAVLDAVPAGIWIPRDPSYGTVQANRLASAWMHIPKGANSSKSGTSLLRFDIFDKDGLPVPNEELPLRRSARGEEVTGYEFEWRFQDGERRYLYGNATPLRDADGNIAGGVAAFIDVTERKRAEARLRESEERFRGIFENAGTGIAITDLQGQFQSCNPAFTALLGYTQHELLARDFQGLVYPEDREENIAAGVDLRAGAIPSFELFNRYIRKDGSAVWVHKRVSLLRDAAGKPTHHIALVTDMTERKRYEEYIKLLMAEVNHRAKNMLAVVQAIARQTSATNAKDFVDRFGERVRALAASQDLLVKSGWRGVDLRELVCSQLAHFSDSIGARIDLCGPPLSISASAAQTLGMALHELSTNAGKYGALSTAAGQVEVTWSSKPGEDGSELFSMQWRESGGPSVTVPDRRGFGSTVISQAVRMSLDADVVHEFPRTGAVWRMECLSNNVLDRSH